MFIIPYFLKSPKSSTTGFAFTVAWIFTTDGGSNIWQTDEETLSEESILQDYLEPNGFIGTSKGIIENCLVFQVDPDKTNLSDFYTWTDFLGKGQIPPLSCDVWRPFQWISDTSPGEDKDVWGWRMQAEKLSLGNFGSLEKVWDTINRTLQ